ncbi:hypothetical protein M0R45_030858 [Rubus argutus]|uniref:Homeobox domain-containing protein n=1 Tax=Rubus argutus TaxID=59490 RepID=A0AAW1WFK5_RUBAR
MSPSLTVFSVPLPVHKADASFACVLPELDLDPHFMGQQSSSFEQAHQLNEFESPQLQEVVKPTSTINECARGGIPPTPYIPPHRRGLLPTPYFHPHEHRLSSSFKSFKMTSPPCSEVQLEAIQCLREILGIGINKMKTYECHPYLSYYSASWLAHRSCPTHRNRNPKPFQVAELPALPEALPEGGFLDMIQYVESLAQPEAELQAPIQAVEQPVFPEAGPSQRRAPRSKRYSHVQIKALETFIAVHPTPTYEQKFLLSQQIGLTMKKINKWILKHKAPVIQSDEQLIAELISRNEELLKEIEELKMQNRILINALQAGNCPQCGGPVPPPGVQQQPRVDVNPPQPEFLEVSSDDSIDQELLWGDIRDFMPTSTEHSLMLVPSEDLTCSRLSWSPC